VALPPTTVAADARTLRLQAVDGGDAVAVAEARATVERFKNGAFAVPAGLAKQNGGAGESAHTSWFEEDRRLTFETARRKVRRGLSFPL
jgi:hypothetical protein